MPRFVAMLSLLCLAVPTAESAPSFPLQAEGQFCDDYVCYPMNWVLNQDGTAWEYFWETGVYRWERETQTFEAQMSFLNAHFIGTRSQSDPRCIFGDYTTDLTPLAGSFYFCIL